MMEGKKVLCISKRGYQHITVGKEYTVISMVTFSSSNALNDSFCFYKLINDRNEYNTYDIDNFICIKELRKSKLLKLSSL